MTDLIVPKLGLTITEVEVVEWLKPLNSRVAAGETVVVLNADKTDVEVAATHDGVLTDVLAVAGDVLAVGGLLGRLSVQDRVEAGTDRAPATPRPSAAARPVARPAAAPPAAVGRVPSSPAARRLAGERQVTLVGVTGSGPNGRIVERDVPATRPAGRPLPSADGGVDTAGRLDATIVLNAAAIAAALVRADSLGVPASPATVVVAALARLLDGSLGWTILAESDICSVLVPGSSPTAYDLAVSPRGSDAAVAVLVIDASSLRTFGLVPPGGCGSSLVVTVGQVAQTVVVAGGGVAVQPQLTIGLAASLDHWSAAAVFELGDALAAALEAASPW